ncbi:MAG: acetate kinase [bacterium]|nr:acetate kinase [bacterium]
MIVLTINCGSSSVKYMLYNHTRHAVLAEGIVERIGLTGSFIQHEVPHKPTFKEEDMVPEHHEAIKLITHTLTREDVGVLKDVSCIKGVGHRVVHGGEHFIKSVLIDGPNGRVVKTFRNLSELAPLHNPNNILGIVSAMDILPDVPHVAVMDTAFLQTMPKHIYLYAVPYDWYTSLGIRKYGFHGTSHLYVSRRAAVMLNKENRECNLITCHIGNGVSFTAIKDGSAYDHSMGFTPLEGLIMGTRSGDLDPAILEYVALKDNFSISKIITILNKESGLKGITGIYSDRRDILEGARNNDERCQLAIDMEVHRIKKYIGAYMSVLGRVDAIVFTAGAGERHHVLREMCLSHMENLGIYLDIEKNRQAVSHNCEYVISKDNSPVKAFVIPTDEELVIIEDTVAIINGTYDICTNFRYSFEDRNYVNNMRQELYEKEMAGNKII